MNELPRIINGATLPEGEEWHNPANFKAEDFGPDHRPMTKTEWEKTDAGLTVEVWSDSLSGVWIPKPFLQYRYLTYRLPAATPFLMPEKEWTPKFSVGDWVKTRMLVKTFCISNSFFHPALKEIAYNAVDHGDSYWVESSIEWTLGPSINGHTLQPGQRWQGELDNWKQEDLPPPWRPCLEGEIENDDCQDRPQEGGQWTTCVPIFMPVETGDGYLTRTTRPLPKLEKVEPESHPAVTEELLSSALDAYMESGSSIRPSKLGLKLALSHAFSQVLPGLEEKLKFAYMDSDTFSGGLIEAAKQRDTARSELQKARAEIEALKARESAISDARLEAFKRIKGDEIADLTRRLEEADKANLELDRQCKNHWANERAHAESRDAHKARADKAEAELKRDRTVLENINASLANHLSSLRQQLATKEGEIEARGQKINELGGMLYDNEQTIKSLRAELASLQWTPLSVRKPTAEDADGKGWITVVMDGQLSIVIAKAIEDYSGITHWRRTNLPAVERVEPTEREEFEKTLEGFGVPLGEMKEALFSWWQANKAMEGKP